MSLETDLTLQKSLDAIDSIRKRIFISGWIVVAVTIGMYARFAYLQRTTDDVERLLSAAVAALTFLIVWAAFAVIMCVMRMTKRILRAIELSSRAPI